MTQEGHLLGKMESHWAAIALSKTDSYRKAIPAFAGRMKIPIDGAINDRDEKEWWKDIREWRVAHGMVAVTDSGESTNIGMAQFEPRGMKRTCQPNEMWAAHISELKAPHLLPRSQLGTSTEADWNAFIRRSRDVRIVIGGWADSVYDFDSDGQHDCECGLELNDTEDAVLHHSEGPIGCA